MKSHPTAVSRRRFFLPLLPLLLASAPTTRPTPPLLTEAHRLLSNLKESEYTHKTTINEAAGSYHCDCSGLLDYLLKRTSPDHYKLLPHPPGKRPLAVHFHDAFARAPIAGTQRVPGDIPTWHRVPSLKEALPGDIIAWRRPELTPGEDTGHVILLDSTPTPDGPNVYKLTIIDSTKSPHANDTRQPNQTGVGRGTLWLQTDDAGAPTGYRWKSNGTTFKSIPIAIGRPSPSLHAGAERGGTPESADRRSAAPDSSNDKGAPMSTTANQPSPESLLDQFKHLPPDAAVSRAISLGGTPAETAQRLYDLANASYWKSKDLPSAVLYSLAGIRYALAEADRAADADLSLKLKGLAKSTAYNLASFTWPGWDEPGITVTPTDLTAGRDAAALNLRLATDLKRPPLPLANAHWLVGAHALSAGDYDAALASFAQYHSVAPTDDHRHLADGYTAITLLAAHRDEQCASTQFDTAVAALLAMNTDDSKFFATQLQSVRKFFVK